MTIKEINKRIESEIRRKKRLAKIIDDSKADMRATNKALHFWQCELAKAKKLEK